jgi:predicted DNA-binding transcriptional regulator AlpA
MPKAPQTLHTLPAGRRFFSYPDLIERGIKYTRVHLRRMELAGKLPMHVKLGVGSGTTCAIAWVAAEILTWEDERIAQRDRHVAQRGATKSSRPSVIPPAKRANEADATA